MSMIGGRMHKKSSLGLQGLRFGVYGFQNSNVDDQFRTISPPLVLSPPSNLA